MSTLRSLLLAAPLAALLPGCAGQPATPTPEARAVPLAENRVSRHCLTETRRHLPGEPECITARGIVITREELERTGAPRLDEALRRRVPF